MNLHSHSISSLQGALTVPGDKSISHRAAILGGLAEGVTEVDNFLCSEDCLNTLRAMEQLGAKVDVLEERQGYGPVRFRITGVAMSPKAPERPIDCGNSGRCKYNMLLLGMLADITQKCRFSRTRFPGQKDRLSGVLNQIQCILKCSIVSVYAHLRICLSQIIPKCFIALLIPSSSIGAVT